jgi:hypothetical protein
MFKFAAMSDLQLTVENAIKYQVLTDETAMIGMVMQKTTKMELKKIDTIQFGRRIVKTNEPELPKPRPPRPFPVRPTFGRPVGRPGGV